jgi:soluble cytochrome b562
MSEATKTMRNAIEHSTDALEMLAFNEGFESAISAIDEFSNEAHNAGNKAAAEILRLVAMELRGENA